jgi:hypothetical protein
LSQALPYKILKILRQGSPILLRRVQSAKYALIRALKTLLLLGTFKGSSSCTMISADSSGEQDAEENGIPHNHPPDGGDL